VSLPDRGGDTQYVNMHVAFDELPRETKRRIECAETASLSVITGPIRRAVNA